MTQSKQIGYNSPVHIRRIKWLKRNRKVWEAYSQTNWITIEHELLRLMKKAGLYTPKTTILDVSFASLIGRVRASERTRKKGKK